MPTQGTTTNQTASTNPALAGIFTSIFGGANGAGATGVNSLSKIAGGQNITQLNAALTQGAQQQTAAGATQIKEAFGSSGMSSSSSLASALGKYYTQQSAGLTSSLASADLTAQGQTLSAASYLSQIFSSSANQYYNQSSETSSFDPLQLISTLFG